MNNGVRSWTGDEWQNHCMMLVKRRCETSMPHSLQLVPDRDRGDLGIEAFSQNGFVYQCYAAEEPLTVEQCYKKQRDKLTKDLGKLVSNKSQLHQMLGTIKIKCYVFMVHRHDSKELVIHATNKKAEISAQKLPFVDPNFNIVIETDEDYAVEREQIYRIPPPLIANSPALPAEKDDWIQEHGDLRATMLRKLRKIDRADSQIDGVLETLVDKYLAGENMLQGMKSTFPEAYRAFLEMKSDRESVLALEYPDGNSPNSKKMRDISIDFTREIEEDLNIFTGAQRRTLAWASIAEWLMRCPLDFEEI